MERDYRTAYDDVQRLGQLGLIEIQTGKLHVPYDEIEWHVYFTLNSPCPWNPYPITEIMNLLFF